MNITKQIEDFNISTSITRAEVTHCDNTCLNIFLTEDAKNKIGLIVGVDMAVESFGEGIDGHIDVQFPVTVESEIYINGTQLTECKFNNEINSSEVYELMYLIINAAEDKYYE